MKLSKFFTVKAQSGNQPAQISIRGVIGDTVDTYSWTVKNTETEVLNALKDIPAGTKIDVRVNSEGGEMQCALGIRNVFAQRAGDLTFYNDGYMASSAAILAPAASRVVCPPSSFVMIHNPSAAFEGDAKAAEKAAATLKAHADVYAAIIAERTGQTKDEVLALMDAETWWTGEQAVALKYATDDGADAEPDQDFDDQLVIHARASKVFAQFKNVPETLRQRITASAPTPNNNPTPKNNMKLVINALAAAGFAISADADESAVLPHITALLTERNTLQRENKAFAEARDARVTALVTAAIADKIVAETRKDGLIALGKTNEAEVMAQISELRAAKVTATAPRGAKPAKFVAEGASEDEINARLGEIETELENRNTRPEVRAALSREALKLRGLDTLVKPMASIKAI